MRKKGAAAKGHKRLWSHKSRKPRMGAQKERTKARGLTRMFHEGRAPGCVSHRHTVLLAALGPRRSPSYAYGPRLPDALSAGGWLGRVQVQTAPRKG